MKSTVRLIAVLLLILAFPPIVRADFRQFIPRIAEYHAFLTVDSSYEKQENTTNDKGITSKDLFLRETLQLSSVGYVFDPRFITFVVKVSGGLKHESFSIDSLSEPFNTMSASEYTFRMVILPEHPYNLELYALRVEPLTRRAFLQSQSVAYSKGAIFRYKRKPYFLNVHYVDNSTDSPQGSYSTKKYGFIATYYKELGNEKFYSYSASYDHTTSSYIEGGSTDEAALAGNYFLKKVSFSSHVNYQKTGQGQGLYLTSLSNKTLDWGGSANLRLPWNFTSGFAFDWNKSTFKTYGQNSEQSLSSTSRSASLTISHKLYSSLSSNYDLGYNTLDSESGRSTTLSNSLGLNYVKIIPWGKLRSGFSIGRTSTDRKGVQSVPNETHSGIRVPGSFTLNNRDINASTIVVFARHPESAEELVPLTQDTDYVVLPFGNTYQITILNLPVGFIIPGAYDFVVSYTLNNAESKLVTDTLNYTINFDLFHDMLYPYYNHARSRQTVSGNTEEVPWNYSSDEFGAMFVKSPFTASASYTRVSSDINPSREWKVEATYSQGLTRYIQAQAQAHYSSTYYPQGTGIGGVSYSDRLFGASASVQKRFPRHNMYVAFVSSYSRDESLSRSDSYSLGANYVWNEGKIHVVAGATGSFSTSEFAGGKNKWIDQYYYLTIKRKLF